MKTNFFQQIAGLGFNGNLLLNIHQSETGMQTVSVIVKKENAIGGLPPMLLKATAAEMDEGFFEQLAQPVRQTAALISNLETYRKELEKAGKNAKPDTTKANKPNINDGEEEESDESSNLFTPKSGDKEAKAEKRRLYDEAMEKVKELAQNTKYAEALSVLPDVADYPDKAEAIEVKRKTLQASKATYDKLTASFND